MANVLSISERHAGRVGDAGDRLDVEHFEIRVPDRLRQDQPGFRPDRGREAGVVPRRDERRAEAEARQGSREKIDGSAVERGRRDDVIAGAGQRGDGEMQRRHAARRRHGADAALERREAFFEHGDGRIGDAAIDVAGALEIEQRRGMFGVAVDVGRRLVDRDGARAVVRIGALPAVEGERVESRGGRRSHVDAFAQQQRRDAATRRTPV